MGNHPPQQNNRSFSDELMSHRPVQQRPHASSDALPYRPRPRQPQKENNNNNKTNPNNSKTKPVLPIFTQKKNHYNPISPLKSNAYKPGHLSPTDRTHPHSDQNNSESFSIIQGPQPEHSHSSHPKVLIIQGWLTKRGENSKKLKKRYWKLYDNGKLTYSTKQSGSFKKYANLKVGIDAMSLADDTGFKVQVSGRHLTFYAQTTDERDAWFAIIYKYYYQKGQEQVILLAKSSGDRHDEEAKDKFELPKLEIITEKYNKKSRKSRRKKLKRRNSFDSTKAAVALALKEKQQRAQKSHNPQTPPATHTHSRSKYVEDMKRSRSATDRRNGNGRNAHAPKEDGMIIFSEQYMSQICDGKTCLSLERVHYVLKKYDLWRRKEHKIMSLGMYKYINNGLGEFYDNTHLLNDYNHLLAFHDSVFNHIYEYFDGECEIANCLLIKRLHRDRNYYKNDAKRKQIYYNYEDPKEINTQQILDKIHCFYRHSYDLGLKVKKSKLLSIAQSTRSNHRKWRTSVMSSMHKRQSLTNEESKEAHMIIMQNDTTTDNEEEESTDIKAENDEIDDLDEETHGFEDEWKLLEICGLIQQKRNNLRELRGIPRMDMNKFISTVSKSQRYHYWKKYDDDDDRNWQINLKYNDFKQEMLCNGLYFISLKQWEYLVEKANDHFAMKRSKKIRPHKYWAELYALHNLAITKSHLIAIILYCNFDILTRIFAETFYKQKLNINADEKDNANGREESDIELKNRHSNFYHFGRLLRELIECFGKKIYNKNIVFYHGITEDMMFIETSVYFHAPLSTTTSIEVAIACGENSYLLELMDDDTVLGMARYFDCCWLSDFSGECEKFFLGGYKPLKIHTILDAVLGRNYINYLKAISIIDEMMQGYYFYTDSDEIKHIILHLLQTQIANHKKKLSKPRLTVLNSELLKEIRVLNKPKPKLYLGILSDDTEQDEYDIKQFSELTEMQNQNEIEIESHRRRISRKISESFANLHLSRDKRSSTMDMEEYDYFNETPTYITNLVNYYCENVINVCIDWKNMNDSHLKGFKCCKKLLCVSDDVIKYEWIKLNTFLTLFPNLKELHVRNIKLSQFTIKDIHKFLSKAKENNKYDDLYRIEIFEVDQSEYPIAECLNQYLDKFKEVGWTITFNPFEDEMCILKI